MKNFSVRIPRNVIKCPLKRLLRPLISYLSEKITKNKRKPITKHLNEYSLNGFALEISNMKVRCWAFKREDIYAL